MSEDIFNILHIVHLFYLFHNFSQCAFNTNCQITRSRFGSSRYWAPLPRSLFLSLSLYALEILCLDFIRKIYMLYEWIAKMNEWSNEQKRICTETICSNDAIFIEIICLFVNIFSLIFIPKLTLPFPSSLSQSHCVFFSFAINQLMGRGYNEPCWNGHKMNGVAFEMLNFTLSPTLLIHNK